MERNNYKKRRERASVKKSMNLETGNRRFREEQERGKTGKAGGRGG